MIYIILSEGKDSRKLRDTRRQNPGFQHRFQYCEDILCLKQNIEKSTSKPGGRTHLVVNKVKISANYLTSPMMEEQPCTSHYQKQANKNMRLHLQLGSSGCKMNFSPANLNPLFHNLIRNLSTARQKPKHLINMIEKEVGYD